MDFIDDKKTKEHEPRFRRAHKHVMSLNFILGATLATLDNCAFLGLPLMSAGAVPAMLIGSRVKQPRDYMYHLCGTFSPWLAEYEVKTASEWIQRIESYAVGALLPYVARYHDDIAQSVQAAYELIR